MHTLLDIIQSFESAYEGGTADGGAADFAPVLAAAVDPLVDMCERSAEALSASAPSRCRPQHILRPLAELFAARCLLSELWQRAVEALTEYSPCAEGRADAALALYKGGCEARRAQPGSSD